MLCHHVVSFFGSVNTAGMMLSRKLITTPFLDTRRSSKKDDIGVLVMVLDATDSSLNVSKDFLGEFSQIFRSFADI